MERAARIDMRLTIPNSLTLVRFLLTPVFYFLLIDGSPDTRLLASIIFIAAALTDWYDGYFARRLGMVTRWGQFMDPLADKVLISAALAVLAQLDYLFWWMVIVIISRDFIVTFLRLFALYIGKPIITTVVAKWKTFLQMTFVLAVLVYINIPGVPEIRLNMVTLPWLQWTTIVVSIIILLTAYSGIYYLIVNRLHIIELWRIIWQSITRKKVK